MTKMKITGLLSLPLIIFGLCGYAFLWMGIATQMNQQIDMIWANAKSQDIVIAGDKHQVYGFPLPPYRVISRDRDRSN